MIGWAGAGPLGAPIAARVFMLGYPLLKCAARVEAPQLLVAAGAGVR